jgi:hypothetical protein
MEIRMKNAMKGLGLTVAIAFCITGFGRATQAALIFPTANGVSQTQLSLVVTSLANGDSLFTTTDSVTNNNAFTVNGIYEVVRARDINGSVSQWDNAAQLWRLGALTTRPVKGSE